MHTLEFTTEEMDVLRDVLRHSTNEIQVEVVHTDSHEYKEMLKRRQRVLNSLAAKVSAEPILA